MNKCYAIEKANESNMYLPSRVVLACPWGLEGVGKVRKYR